LKVSEIVTGIIERKVPICQFISAIAVECKSNSWESSLLPLAPFKCTVGTGYSWCRGMGKSSSRRCIEAKRAVN
jgi:hypothetical protein